MGSGFRSQTRSGFHYEERLSNFGLCVFFFFFLGGGGQRLMWLPVVRRSARTRLVVTLGPFNLNVGLHGM